MPESPSLAVAKYYSPLEEKINIGSHAMGFVLSVIALVFLLIHSIQNGSIWHIVGFTIFGSSLMVLYGASTLYHRTVDPQKRSYMRFVDHASIYVLIAGSYTPFTLVTLNSWVGWLMFGLAWSMAITGIVLKLFFTGRYSKVSTAMYLFMGWMMVFAMKPLIENLADGGLNWLIAGGLWYTFGAILYSIKKIKFNHALFHICVLFGSFSHFMAVYFYVLPV